MDFTLEFAYKLTMNAILLIFIIKHDKISLNKIYKILVNPIIFRELEYRRQTTNQNFKRFSIVEKKNCNFLLS